MCECQCECVSRDAVENANKNLTSPSLSFSLLSRSGCIVVIDAEMATAMRPHDSDSDSDYGYDLSAEDEQFLFATVASTSSSHVNQEANDNNNLFSLSLGQRKHIDDLDIVLDRSLETDYTRRASPKFNDIGAISIHSHAPDLLSTPQGKAPIMGIARTDSVGEFAEKTTPRSTPTVNPVDDISYPDCKLHLPRLCHEVVLTDPEALSGQSLIATPT